MSKKTFYINKLEGSLKEIFIEIYNFYNNSNKTEFQIEVKEIKDIRSLKQNRFYWGVIIPAFMRLGYDENYNGTTESELTKEYYHELLGSKFISYTETIRVKLPSCQKCNVFFQELTTKICNECKQYVSFHYVDVPRTKIKSTTVLSIEEFSKYLEQCIDLLGKAGGYLTTSEYNEYQGIYY